MKTDKPVLVFIFPGCMGGVASYNRNLINHTTLKEQCYLRVILLDPFEDKRPRFKDAIEADEIIHFAYSHRENQYSVCKRLHKIIGDEAGCIIADNSLTLNALSVFGSVKKMVYLVHDYFYVTWALHYHRVIDVAVAHSSFFRDILLASGIIGYQDKVFYIPYGVELPSEDFAKPVNSVLKLVFLGRLIEEKGVLLLKDIDNHLQKDGIKAKWTIIGKGYLEKTLDDQWKGCSNVRFVQASDTQAVYSILREQDILVFPSWFEGTPVSIMEALSRGVIPVVSDLPGGTRDMVTEEIGIRCHVRNAIEYAKAIEDLYRNPTKMKQMQKACIHTARERYDINKAADSNFSFFIRQSDVTPKTGVKHIARFSNLDREFIPNWVVYNLRTLKQYLSSR